MWNNLLATTTPLVDESIGIGAEVFQDKEIDGYKEPKSEVGMDLGRGSKCDEDGAGDEDEDDAGEARTGSTIPELC